MICPYCETENREELDRCYNCQKDLTMLRLIINRAHHHYNLALEHAERGRNENALLELQNSLELNYRNAAAHVLLGTVLARLQRFEEAREEWNKALTLTPTLQKAHDYLAKGEVFKRVLPSLRFYQVVAAGLFALALVLGVWLAVARRPDPAMPLLRHAFDDYKGNRWGAALHTLSDIGDLPRAKPESKQLADMLEAVINDQKRLQRQAAAQAVRRRDYVGALEAFDFLLERNLGEVDTAEARNQRQQLVDTARTEMERSVEQYLASGFGYDRATITLDRAASPGMAGLLQVNVEELRAKVEEARRKFENLDIAEIQAEWRRDQNHDYALIRLFRLMEQSEPTPETEDLYALILKGAQEERNGHIRDLAKGGRPAQADAYLDESVAFLPDKIRDDILAGVATPEQVKKREEARRYEETMASLARAKQWDAFLQRVDEAASYALSAAQKKDLETTTTLARKELAQQEKSKEKARREKARKPTPTPPAAAEEGATTPTLAKPRGPDQETTAAVEGAEPTRALMDEVSSQEMDAEFDSPPGDGVPKETAERFLGLWDKIDKQIPEDAPARRRQFDFYRAVAAYRLDRTDEARSLFQTFLDQYEGEEGRDYIDSARKYVDLLDQSQPAEP